MHLHLRHYMHSAPCYAASAQCALRCCSSCLQSAQRSINLVLNRCASRMAARTQAGKLGWRWQVAVQVADGEADRQVAKKTGGELATNNSSTQAWLALAQQPRLHLTGPRPGATYLCSPLHATTCPHAALSRLSLGTHPPSPPAQGNAGDEEQDAVGEGESYQLEMMRCLREVNVDNNTVGWYVRACVRALVGAQAVLGAVAAVGARAALV